VQSGKLGELIAVNGLFSYFNKDGANIRNIATYGGGALMDIGCYAVSSARYLMGTEPVRVISALTRDPSFKTDAMVSAILDFGKGKTAVFSVSTQMSPYQRVTAIGTGGSFSIEIPFNMPADAPGRITFTDSDGKRLVETELANQYRLEFDSFAESFIQKAEVPTPITDAVANMAVLDALFESAVSGAWETVQRY
jgi:predicted dehydrogenase